MTIREVSKKYNITQDTLRYYERVGMIPTVTRTAGGIRDYGEKDLEWVELAVCMRSAGLPVDAMVKYVKLSQVGDSTLGDRLDLLKEQREILLDQKEQMEETLKRLNVKISRYEAAMETGKLVWDSK